MILRPPKKAPAKPLVKKAEVVVAGTLEDLRSELAAVKGACDRIVRNLTRERDDARNQLSMVTKDYVEMVAQREQDRWREGGLIWRLAQIPAWVQWWYAADADTYTSSHRR